MKRKVFLLTLFAIAGGIFFTQILAAQTPTAAELLRRIDDNQIFHSIQYDGEMIIEHQNRRFVKTFRAWARGNMDSFMEFTNPEDRGTRYLRTDGRLFVFSPDTERVMIISGHMLRESMMGSDLSYEDAMDNEPLSARYTPTILRQDILNGRPVWLLELNAINRTESYPRRLLYIDQENGDLLRSELFALSGAMLREHNILRVEVVNGRRFPVEVEVRDLLRRGSRTIFRMNNVIMDRPIADSIFTQRNLRG